MAMNPRLLRPLASGFNPKSISGLAGWWDGSDPATLFDATSGGSLVAASGTVGRWEDKSGNGRHATQGNGNSRPVRSVAAFNGRDALDFDGANDFLALSSTIETVNGASIFMVAKKRSNDTSFGGSALHTIRGTTIANRNHHPFTDGNGYDGFARNARISFAFAFDTNLYVLSTVVGAQYTFRKNETVLSQGSYTAASQLAGEAQGFGGSDPITLTQRPVDGFICEAIIYTRGVNEAEFTSIYRYLRNKWGVVA
jgi:hypothetical protein